MARHKPGNRRRVWVVVLGDFGRSPRMQYHTHSLCKAGFDVRVIAYPGSPPIPSLLEAQQQGSLTLHLIGALPAWLPRLPAVIRHVLKAILQACMLLWMLLASLPPPSAILVQLPPSIPTMLVCWLAAQRHRAKLIYDWHNFGYTLMAISLGRRHSLVRLAERYERFWGRKASANFCVTKAMQAELGRSWGVPATVFYDRAPDFFRLTSLRAKHELLCRLNPELAKPMHAPDWCSERLNAATSVSTSGRASLDGLSSKASGRHAGGRGSAGGGGTGAPMHAIAELEENGHRGSGQRALPSICTVVAEDGSIALRPDRPALIVSSTSWTPDEDFGLLLKAAQLYDAKARKSVRSLPNLLICVTGKGPQRAGYEERMRSLDLRHVAFRTLWLEPSDYPLLLGSADLGVCLHTSSSGLDLPMKVVDMFGCGLPVCAASYSCIGELVSHGNNGLLFSSSAQLAEHFVRLLRGFPGTRRSSALDKMQQAVEAANITRWDDSWRHVVWPAFSEE